MQSKEIVTQIDRIYERFHIMPQLALHMKRVAGVASFIADHWNGPHLDRDLLLAAALTHDLGNIAKVDFDAPYEESIMGAEFKRLDHWRGLQRELTAKYGTEEYEMTGNMLSELQADRRLFGLIAAAGFRQNVQTAQCDDWHCKILAHADHLVSPHGVVTLAERLQEGARRYGYIEDDNPLVKAAHLIEEQIARHMTVPVSAITEESVTAYRKRF